MNDERRAWLGLSRVTGIGPSRFRRLLDTFGSAAEAWSASVPELRAAGLDERTAQSVAHLRSRHDFDAEVASMESLGISALCLDDAGYPRSLRQLDDAPPVLFVRGTLLPADEWAIAIVGTRHPTAYGREVTRAFAAAFAQARVTVVSGLAQGIDSLAHDGALEAGGRTLAIQACGLDLVYPATNAGLARRILESGAILSEYPIGTRPHPSHFPVRNRLIAGLTLGTLVVEGTARSGALITARQALDQNRDVFAVPGSILNAGSEGPNQLIREGEARLVTTPQQVLEELNLLATLRPAARQDPAVPTATATDPVQARLLEELGTEPLHLDELARATGIPVAAVSAALLILELSGMVRQVGALTYMKVRG